MRPREQSKGQDDLFRSRLDQIIDMRHELVRLGGLIDWRVIGDRFGEVYSDGPGQPPLPTRLMAGLAILKHTFNLSDEELVARWVENPYFQHFCGEEHFRHKAPFDRSSMTRWRQRMGAARLEVLLQESLAVAVKTDAVAVEDLSKVIVDTTVQEKAIAFPTDAKLLNRARVMLVKLAKAHGVKLRQGYPKVGKLALIKYQRYAHAKQWNRARRELRRLRTFLGRVKRGVTKAIKRELRRRAAVEPVIGHMKNDHRMDRNHLIGSHGDAANAVLAAIGYNFRRLAAWLRQFLHALVLLLIAARSNSEIARRIQIT